MKAVKSDSRLRLATSGRSSAAIPGNLPFSCDGASDCAGTVRAGSGVAAAPGSPDCGPARSEEHTSELQSLMRISYAVFCLKKKHQHLSTTNDKTSYA